ncbi:MAG: hypothetical protein CL441_05840, partial [Acidimicrobiaceae bacterium]|nr:hypothetical protein [Acidimicrobiaceae bacterium]
APGPAVAQPPQFSFDWPAVAARLVDQLDPSPGERVLLVARPGLFDDLIPHLRYAVMETGAVDLGVIDVVEEPWPAAWQGDVLTPAADRARAAYREMLAGVEASIMLPGARPDHPVYAALQDLLRDGQGRTIHFHWVENGSAFTLPGQPLPPRHVIDATYQRALLETGYEALAAIQERFEQAMRGAEIRVTSPLGTDLRFRIGDRPVNRQDGDASAARTDQGVILIDREIELPAGAIRVAPIESSVDGTIVFPSSQWDGRPVDGLTLTIDAGRVTGVAATRGQAAAEAELAGVPEEARAFREFALGFNPLLAVPERGPWIPYYGYGAGIVRLSLGDNSELGGDVGGGYVRWNFFTDTTVTVGDEVWVRDGRLTVP